MFGTGTNNASMTSFIEQLARVKLDPTSRPFLGKLTDYLTFGAVMDNANCHKSPATKEIIERHFFPFR